MAKNKKGGKKKRVAAHIRENQGKRAAAAASDSGEVGADRRAPLLASPLGVGKPKRPREPGEAHPVWHVLLSIARARHALFVFFFMVCPSFLRTNSSLALFHTPSIHSQHNSSSQQPTVCYNAYDTARRYPTPNPQLNT